MLVTKSDIKLRQDFKTQTLFLDYLESICTLRSLHRTIMKNRLFRGWHPYDVITTSRQLKPPKSHPFKRNYPHGY